MLDSHKAWLQRLGGTRLVSEVLYRVDLSFQPPSLQQILSLEVILITSLFLFLVLALPLVFIICPSFLPLLLLSLSSSLRGR